jgi:Hemerythrin HHE cation binding domain
MTLTVPESLRSEHGALHAFLVGACREAGELGEAARLLARLMDAHAGREEQFALPPLGLLAALARGELRDDMAEAFIHTDWLRKNLDTMLAEHRVILAALERVLAAARAAARADVVAFAEKLAVHARLEEEVLYPAALLVGEVLRQKLGRLAYAAATA